MKPAFDIHTHITDQIVAAIERGAGKWQMPWHRGTGGRKPVNIASGKAYRGVNMLALWVDAQVYGYGSHVWGTYKQWAEVGAQVRKGQKAAYVVFYKEIEVKSADASPDEPETRLFARATPVFNSDQLDGYETPAPIVPFDSHAAAEALVTRTGAVIEHEGRSACYIPKLDIIRMPPRELFNGSATSTATEAYYSTLFHELAHWTGAKSRCNRDMTSRFGSEAYAMEELVAELGSAFLCADVGLTSEPRPDHAQYLANWLTVLKADKRAIFTAASKAAQAASFLSGNTA